MARRGRSRRHRGHDDEHENDERWLLTYADMITLLMALFMVLFSISSVNKSKFVTLQKVLKDAFSGKVLPGGEAVAQAGSNDQTKDRAVADAAVQRLQVERIAAITSPAEALRQQAEQDEFRRLKRQIDRYAQDHGLAATLQTEITRRGLVIRLLTDRIVFDSGQADIKPAARALLDRLGQLLRTASLRRPVQVDGHTDSQPIHSGPYPDNWALSTARATSVVRFFVAEGMNPRRVSAGGFAYFHPLQSNSTAAGRARNRRVEILLARRQVVPAP
jgi:chemotaxis protein MotB